MLQRQRGKVGFAQLPVDFVAIEPDSVQGVGKRANLTNRCFIIRINDSFKKRQGFIEFISNSGSGHTVTVYAKRRFQRGVFMNSLNTNVVKPVMYRLRSSADARP
ncbi:hypothetical protein BLM77_22515 [Shigella sonnei]|nr:hypothetical protein [Shigella sonnei]